MGEWTNIYDWVVTVLGEPPASINTGNYSTTWSPTELIAYATACCILILAFKILFYIIRRLFGGQ